MRLGLRDAASRREGMIPGSAGGWWPRNVQERLYPYNEYNACLIEEGRVWRRINDCGGIRMVCPGSHYAEPPWIVMPAQGKRFSKISSIALPNPDGLDTVVAQFTVPTGYDGCVVGLVNMYTGQNFQEGSGDLTWRVRLHQRYVKDYGAITTTIGSLQIPYTVNAGQILLESDQLVRYYVNRSVASAGNINGGRVICGLFGWWWPR